MTLSTTQRVLTYLGFLGAVACGGGADSGDDGTDSNPGANEDPTTPSVPRGIAPGKTIDRLTSSEARQVCEEHGRAVGALLEPFLCKSEGVSQALNRYSLGEVSDGMFVELCLEERRRCELAPPIEELPECYFSAGCQIPVEDYLQCANEIPRKIADLYEEMPECEDLSRAVLTDWIDTLTDGFQAVLEPPLGCRTFYETCRGQNTSEDEL